MSIVKMKRLSVIGLDTEKEQFVSKLMNLGALEVTDEDPQGGAEQQELPAAGENPEAAELDQKISDTETAIEALKEHSPVKSPLFFTRREMKKTDFQSVLQHRAEFTEETNGVLELKEQIRRLTEQRNRKESELSSVIPWKPYTIPLNFTGTRCTDFTLGVVPVNITLEDLQSAASEISETAVLEKVNEDKEYRYLLLITWKPDTAGVEEALKQRGFTVAAFPDFKDTASEAEVRLHNEIAELSDEVKKVGGQIAARYGQKKDIECLHDQLVMERDQVVLKGKLLQTKRTFRLTGWIPEGCMTAAKKMLDSCECYYLFEDPREDETVPVLLKNNAFVAPFESVTEMYSLPDYHGIDPTKWFSLFYACFFGMMLSDAGYGILLTVVTAVILHKFKIEGNLYHMVKMFLYCGISTIFWGAMFGGWFGNSVNAIAATFFHSNAAIKPIWFDPISNPTKLLIFSLGLGVVHIFLGMGLDAGMKIRRGHFWDAVFDDFSWYMVIGGIILMIALNGKSTGGFKAGEYIMIAGFIILLLTGGRDKKGFGKVIGGITAIYNITGFLSDILSYARLLALGLATGVIAQVVNTIGTLSGGGVKGAIILAVVFVIGHIFNLAINALGSFVHTSRLQYIEFFGKFYEDGGEPFNPFRRNTKYVRLTD
ncbi:MAG: V-type ATP synthase subunit I [Eubacterium sp.]|nr:V-type ATP synthase subunit I [Eubacterium sp.]MCH4046660.1 V-type ATP synthase subunit I [Eubacterium sp.]MCH4079756.1 V-type ATP synthase subunit I [Eubacterium sp.]MCH4110316.1 V-type ATP synthase subunit I [Eubacterium sp.]MCI1307071.1 V-type ATP synthase subunit I [Eubacterium sp.]